MHLSCSTDGQDNKPYTNPDDGVSYTLLGGGGTTALPVSPDVRVYGVGIGDSIDTGRLAQLAQATGGQLHVLTFAGLDFFKLEKHFTRFTWTRSISPQLSTRRS